MNTNEEEVKDKHRNSQLNVDAIDEIQYRSMAMTLAPSATRIFQQPITKQHASLNVHIQVDSIDYSALQIMQVPDIPSFLEAHTHFNVTGSRGRIGATMSRFLSNLQASFTVQVNKAKWKILVFYKGEYIDCRIRMYRREEKSIVEMQRRRGDIVRYMQLYQALYTYLVRQRMVPAGVQIIDEKIPNVSPTLLHIPSALPPLVEMMASPYADTQVLGLQGLLSLANHPTCCSSLSSVIIPLLSFVNMEYSLSSDHRLRMTMHILACCCSTEGCQSVIMKDKKVRWKMIMEMATTDALSPDIRRNALVIVYRLCPTYSSTLGAADEARKVCEMVTQVELLDTHLRREANQARKVFLDTGVMTSP